MKKVMALFSLFSVAAVVFAQKKVLDMKGYVSFPEEKGVVYIDDLNAKPAEYECYYSLENYLAFEDYVEVRPLNKCLMSAASDYGPDNEILPPALLEYNESDIFSLKSIAGYGIKDGIFFYIYNADEFKPGISRSGLVRGCDVTRYISKAEDYELVYQKALKLSIEERKGSVNGLVESFKNSVRIESAGMKGMENILTAYFYYKGAGMKVNQDFVGSDSLSVCIRRNMAKPVPILCEHCFSGGYGGGSVSEYLYSIGKGKESANVHEICNFRYLSTDGGPDGFGYFYTTKDSVCTYVYESEYVPDGLQVNQNTWCSYKQDPENPRKFIQEFSKQGEPLPSSKSDLREGMKVNSICNIKMRSNPGLSGEKIMTIPGGTVLKIRQAGNTEEIDGVSAPWIQVEITDSSEYKNAGFGWVYSGYVE